LLGGRGAGAVKAGGGDGRTDGKELCLKVCNTIAARAIIIANTQCNTIPIPQTCSVASPSAIRDTFAVGVGAEWLINRLREYLLGAGLG